MSDSIAASDDLLCPQCGYNLRGIESDRCPECGFNIDRESLSRSIIPWTFRGEIGITSAFIKTVILAIRHPRRLAIAASRPVDYHDAQKFRWLVVLLAWLPLCATVLVIRGINKPTIPMFAPMLFYSPPQWWMDPALCEFAGVTLWPILSIALFMFIAAITGVAGYFFQPRSLSIVQQNRAIALSHYACASMMFLIVPCLLFDAAGLMIDFGQTSSVIASRVLLALILSGLITLAAIIMRQWFIILLFLKFTTHCTTLRLIAAAILQPILWLILLTLTLGVFTAMCGFVRLLIFSYRV